MSKLSRWVRSHRTPAPLRTIFQLFGRLEWYRDPLTLLMEGLSEELGLSKAIHVGAHFAEERETYEALGFSEVLWVEASRDIYRELVERLARPTAANTRHVAVNALLSDRNGEEYTLRHFSNDGASNSIFPGNPSMRNRWPDVFETGSTEVLLSKTLDRVAAIHGFDAPDLVAADVQGAELMVLKGATQLLTTAKAVVVEVSTVPIFDGGVLQPELSEFLRSRGFKEFTRPPDHGDQLYIRA
jgi:FkbM family methyltransferase